MNRDKTKPVPRQLSREEQIKEIVKCGRDPVHFMLNYAKIQHPIKGILPFEMYPFQEDCVRAFEEHRLNIVAKARQLGLSTVTAVYVAWLAIFYKDKNILVIATKLNTAINFIKKVKIVLDNMPKWLLLPKFEASRQAIRFSNGSVVTAIPTSDDAGRSEALSLLIVDECAHIKNFEEIWSGLFPTISTGGRCILLSTPKGVGGTYYRLWTEAEAGVNEFNPIRLHWTVHPEHDEEWFKNETKNLSRKLISQEYEVDFISSGDTFLSPTDLEMIRADIEQPIERAGNDRNIWVWEHPQLDKRYVISADVARGDAHDYSAFHVLNITDNTVAAEYMGKVPPEVLTEMLAEWGKKYNTALLIPENNTFGYFVCVKLRDIGYQKLYYSSYRGDHFTRIAPLDKSELPGFQTNVKTRVQILGKLEEILRNRTLRVKSQRLYDQLQAFVWHRNKPTASKDSHDDLIMSLAIGTWLLDGGDGSSERDIAMAQALLNATSVDKKDVSHIANWNNVRPVSNYNTYGLTPKTVNRPRNVFPGENHDFSWLLK